jgi:hypothetical protein
MEINSSSPNYDKIKDFLIISDFIDGERGYAAWPLNKKNKDLSFSSSTRAMIRNGVSNSDAHALLLDKLKNSKRSIALDRYKELKNGLTEKESNSDLKAALSQLAGKEIGLSPKEKEQIKDLLILDDITDYGMSLISGATPLSSETKTRLIGLPTYDISTTFDKEIKLGKIDEVRRELRSAFPNEQPAVEALVKERLDDPEGKEDLKALLCEEKDEKANFCPEIVSLDPASIFVDEKNRKIDVKGNNLPSEGEIIVAAADGLSPSSYQYQGANPSFVMDAPHTPAEFSIKIKSARYDDLQAPKPLRVEPKPVVINVVPPVETVIKEAIPLIAPLSLVANGKPQELTIVGDNLSEAKTVVVYVIDKAGNKQVLESFPVSQKNISADGKKLSILTEIGKDKLVNLTTDYSFSPTVQGRVEHKALIEVLSADNKPLQIDPQSANFIVHEDFNLKEIATYQLPEKLKKANPSAAAQLAGSSAALNSLGTIPVTLRFNPQVFGNSDRAWKKTKWLELNIDGELSLNLGKNAGQWEYFNGCAGKGELKGPKFLTWFQLEGTGNFSLAGPNSIYNTPYYYEMKSQTAKARLALSFNYSQAFSANFNGEWSYTSLPDKVADGRVRLGAETKFGLSENWRAAVLPSALGVKAGLAVYAQRVSSGKVDQLGGGGFSANIKWNRGQLKDYPLNLYYGWEKNGVSGAKKDNHYFGLSGDLLQVVKRLFGNQIVEGKQIEATVQKGIEIGEERVDKGIQVIDNDNQEKPRWLELQHPIPASK